jgi:hypothetical protein
MNREQFEVGALRLYQVGWLLLVLVTAGTFFMEIGSATVESFIGVVLAVAGPWFLLKLGKWVYRGFVPK